MRKTLKFNGEEVEFSSSAATPILYKQVFRKDLLVIFTDLSKRYEARKKEEEKEESEGNTKKRREIDEIDLDFLELVKGLTYIMRSEAAGGSLFNTLTYDGYVRWLMTLEPNTFDNGQFNADIVALWRGNADYFSESKNSQSQPQENSTPQSTV